ncbi:hypothetical protein Val02_69070 [Virgisporangium aliadipatigenens]|uniref:Nucleic acid/nucleotide deaminase of polymorphic system toxin n=1 Tax=Virgisporangium aliadipatigenens TaxID=741659 RepID=A0A8J4DU69_9ACTN|nr:DUF6244 family protein [Virgisporangium aliadipatigenens]GIJ50021.1 hypothetical protein Val02_69070 [Virgisporangium aliadipatigenens]
MTLIDDLDGDLAAMQTGIARAGEIAGGAERGSADIAAHMAATGFTGIAQAMGRVRSGIGEIRARIAGLGGAVQEARRPVSLAPRQMIPQQTIDILTPIGAALAAVHDGIGTTIDRLVEVQRAAAATLQGGRPGPMLARLEGIRNVLITVGQHCTLAQQHVEAALSEARDAGGGGASPDGSEGEPAKAVADDGGPSSQSPDAERASPPEPAPGFRVDPARSIPDFVSAIATDLHVPPGSKTAGVMTDGQGRRLHNGLLLNGTSNAVVDNYATLKRRWHRLDVAGSHVEGHTSGIMRDGNVNHAVLVVSKRPCIGPLGCHAMLSSLLDRGMTLDVYVAGKDGPVYWGTYTGTGEGVTQR